MTALQMEKELLTKWQALPAEKQREALNFVEALNVRISRTAPLQSALGLCADLNVSISAEEVDAARQEAWGQFSREDF